MSSFRLLTGAAIGAVFAASALTAQPFMSKGEAGGWRIFVNEANNSCFMETTTDEGLIMQMGTGGEVPMGFLALYAKGETDIRDGESGVITIEVGGREFAGEAHAVEQEGFSGGYFIANNPLLGFDLATSPTMTVNPNGEDTFTVDLSNVAAGIEAVRACQQEING